MKYPRELLASMITLFTCAAVHAASSVWTPRISGTQKTLSCVIWTGTRLVATGFDGAFVTSSDGITWTAESDTLGYAYNLAWTGSKVVAVGFNSTLSSPNGLDWTEGTTGVAKTMTHVIWTGSQLVAVGERGDILTSPDGDTWTEHQTDAAYDFTGVVWTGKQLVAVGQAGLVYTSPDGAAWTKRTSGTQADLEAVTWTGSQLVAVGGPFGTVLTSTDGITWDRLIYSNPLYPLYSVLWSKNKLVAVGDDGIIQTSPDAKVWTRIPTDTAAYLLSVTTTGTLLVAVGQKGTILTTPDVDGSGTLPFSEHKGLTLRRTSSMLLAAWPSPGPARANILSAEGREALRVEAARANELAIPLQGLVQGRYWIEIAAPTGRWREPFSVLR